MKAAYSRYRPIIIWLSLFVAMSPSRSFGGAPFLTGDPYPSAYRHWEAYLFSLLDENKVLAEEPDLALPAIELDYGLSSSLAPHLVIPYVWTLQSSPSFPLANGIGDIEAGFKYRLTEETPRIPQIAIVPLLELPTGSYRRNLGNGKLWGKLAVWAQKSWGTWTTYGGFGYVFNPQKNLNNYSYAGWVIQKQFTKTLMLGIEAFAQGASANTSRAFMVLEIGGIYNFTPRFSLLFSVGYSVLGEKHTKAYLGLYWISGL